MTIILTGLNHRTAPVELREKLALTGYTLPLAFETLRSSQRPEGHYPPIHEGVILSTCNRLEVCAVVDDLDGGREHIESFLAGLQGINAEDIRLHLYFLAEEDAVRHLMRVACGLDSMILGESQILGQVTQAFSDAQISGLTGPILSHLMARAIHAGKRARTQTDIGRYTTSISHAAALLVRDRLPAAVPQVLIVGAGEMALLAARALQKHNTAGLTFLNRTYSHASALASEFGGSAADWSQLSEALGRVDAVIAATGAPHTVIYSSDVLAALPARHGRPLLFVDIAVPRDVEITVDDIPGISRYDIDDLQSVVDNNTTQRQAAIPQVEAIIEEELHIFSEWYYSREVSPVIKDLRHHAAEVAQAEIDQALSKLGQVDDHTARVISRLAHRLVNKLLHEPTVRLREQAAAGKGHGYAHALSELFGLQATECGLRQESSHSSDIPVTDAVCSLRCITSLDERCVP